MRLLPILLLVPVLAGCIDDASTQSAEANVSFYRLAYEGSDVVPRSSADMHYGLGVVTNHGDDVAIVSLGSIHDAELGYTDETPHVGRFEKAIQRDNFTGFEYPNEAPELELSWSMILQPQESALVRSWTSLYRMTGGGETVTLGFPLLVYDASFNYLGNTTESWTVTFAPATDLRERADSDAHVQVITVGMWVNGTSFYTNAAGAIQDPEFPGAPGWVSPDDATDPLKIYVYGANRDEQPFGSKDNCYGTTISGFNHNLKGQQVGETRVGLLQPSAAYSGASYTDEHPLYGDALVFMTTVVSFDGTNSITNEGPDPNGACFTPEGTCEQVVSRYGIPFEDCSGPESLKRV